MKNITRTIYGSQLQASLLTGLTHVVEENTTLNEKFGVQSGVSVPIGQNPAARYFCIGMGGHRVVTGADSVPYVSPIQHRPSDAALFRHMPFVMREVTNDLSTTERGKYGLRVEEQHSGRRYFCYYAKRLDLTNTRPQMKETTVIDGSETTVQFTPSAANLSPVAPAAPSTGVISTDGNYLSTSMLIPIVFSPSDVAELINVARIRYDNEQMAVISEIAICSGVDKIVSGAGQGSTSLNYNEVIGAQIVTHITAYYSMGFTNQGFEFTIEMGATEPMLGEGNVTVIP